MPPSVGARPGTSVAAAAHISAPKPNPMPAKAAPSALRAARRLRSTATRSRTAIARPITSPIGNPPVAAPSIGSPDIATCDAGLGQAGGRVLEPLARLGVELGGGLVVADRRVGGAAVVGQPRSSSRPRRRAVARRSRRAPRRSRGRGRAALRGAEDERGLGARLGGEALLEEVLGLLGFDPRDGEVVLERPPAATAPPITAVIPRSTSSVAIRGRRAAAPAIWVRSEVMGGHDNQTQSKNQLSLNLDVVLHSSRWPVSGSARSARRAPRSTTRR